MKVAVTWEMCGYVDIEADTMEEAKQKAAENSNITEIFEYDDDGELVGCVWSK